MAGEYNFLAPVDPFGRLPQDSEEERLRRATAGGGAVHGNDVVTGGMVGQGGRTIPSHTRLDSGAYSPGLLDQAGAALKSDVTGMQGAANRQFGRNTAAAQGVLDTTGRESQGILDESNKESGLLSGFSDELKGYGNRAVDATERNLQGLEGDASKMEGYAGTALDLARAGIATGQAAVGAFNADVHAKIDGLVAGIDRRSRNTLSMVEGGVGPDGQPLSASERWQMHRDLAFDTGVETAQVASQAWDQARNALAGLKMSLANIQEQAGGTALGAGALVKQAGELRLEGGQQRLAAESLRQNYSQIRSQALTLLTSGRASARALAAQMRVAGMSAYADEIYRNPESVVSMFAGLAQMAALATAPGGRNQPGVRFG